MKYFSIICAVALAMVACTSNKKDSYIISGEIEGLPDSSVVVLTPLAHRSLEPIAETLVVDGKFSFEGVAEEPMAVVLTVKNAFGGKTMMLENGETTIAGTVNFSVLENGDSTCDFSDIAVTGSALNDQYEEMMRPRYMLDSIMIKNQTEGRPLAQKFHEARKANNQALMDSIAATPEWINYIETEKKCFAGFSEVLNEAVVKNSDNILGLVAMLKQLSYLSADNREMFEMFSDSIKNTYHGKLIYEELYPVGRPGDKMQPFAGKGTDGSDISLESVCNNNKYVLIDFWASWCGPCRREIPNLKEIYKKYNDKGLEILSVSIDSDDEDWLKAVKDEQLKWLNLRDTDKKISDAYHVSAVPTMYIVDSEGRLVAENLRGEALAEKIAELLDK